MLDSPTSFNVEDFRQRYRNTYGFLQRPGKPNLMVFIKETGAQVTFLDVSGNEFYANLNQGVTFEFLPIIRGWHNTRLGPRYFMRIPERQYHRGISRGNTAVYRLTGGDEQFASQSLELALLEDVFVLKPASSIVDYQAGKTNHFIPNKYFLLTDKTLFMYDRKIGTVQQRRKILLEDSVFKQEVSDFVRRQSLPLEVVSND
jgi:hypothetical protein